MASEQNTALKSKTETELIESILSADPSWIDIDRAGIERAYDLAKSLHRDDRHKDLPYIYHLLRVANRITDYLHIFDVEIITAALLHDSVEDHSDGIIRENVPSDPRGQQRVALERIAEQFSPRVAELVATVTNAPTGDRPKLSYDEQMDIYVDKVRTATRTTDGWIIKFSDWCDNGLGIVHTEELADSPKLAHFRHKYGLVLSIFEQRFAQDDIQTLLDSEARSYVYSQLSLGHERLG